MFAPVTPAINTHENQEYLVNDQNLWCLLLYLFAPLVFHFSPHPESLFLLILFSASGKNELTTVVTLWLGDDFVVHLHDVHTVFALRERTTNSEPTSSAPFSYPFRIVVAEIYRGYDGVGLLEEGAPPFFLFSSLLWNLICRTLPMCGSSNFLYSYVCGLFKSTSAM